MNKEEMLTIFTYKMKAEHPEHETMANLRMEIVKIEIPLSCLVQKDGKFSINLLQQSEICLLLDEEDTKKYRLQKIQESLSMKGEKIEK